MCVCVCVRMYVRMHTNEFGMIFLKYLTSLTLYLTSQNVQTPSVLLTTYTGEFIESYKRFCDSKLKTIEI